MQALDQLQGLFVCAEQDMLAVVEWLTFEFDRASAAAERAAGFEQRDAHPGLGQHQCRGAASPAAADDRYTVFTLNSRHGSSQVLLASHSLRSGVSETRARSTGNPECRISSSRVR